MRQRTRLVIGSLASLALLGATLSGGTSSAGAPPGDPEGLASVNLASDASGGLRIDHDSRGFASFAGVAAGEQIDNPTVTPGMSVAAAAAAHLSRYGPAFGTKGSTFGAVRTTHTVSGQDVVRYTQSVGGVPVIGGEVVLSLRPDRELGSMLTTLSSTREVSPATVSVAAATRTARAAAAKTLERRTTGLQVGSLGRWVFDPAVLGSASPFGARTVWRLEVSGGLGVRRLVLVDDHTGGVLFNSDAVQHTDRVVCDAGNVVANPAPCTSGFARIEGGPASGVSEVNKAYDLSGAVADYYQQIGSIDLTQALGINVGGAKKLASTVRLCPVGQGCPYANAFWDGTQMFYGDTYAGADDVVGHEMTHGVIDQYSELFYWGQSGAINESIADIMGEIVDHRHPSTGDSATDWRLGEDLPIGAIRNLKNPPVFGQPDRMTSSLYTADDVNYGDSGGVHTNSGVGNKTAYLISQGGTFNGQTITGIDGANANLTKTAKLYLDVIESLSSGSDYADLARVINQSCANFVSSGTNGFTAANCANVKKATVATELTKTPTKASQPASASAACPAYTTKHALFDSETGDPESKFTVTGPNSDWVRVPDGVISPNATSGRDSWFSYDPPSTRTSSLTSTTGISLPAGQKSYLWFQHWRLLDYAGSIFYDGGTVEVDDLATPGGPASTVNLPWVNGPTQAIAGNAGKKGFGGDSRGYLASRVDLSSYAGTTVAPQFTMHTDASVEYYGWFVDDIRVYTCTPFPKVSNTKKPRVAGTAKVGKKLTAGPGTWKPAGVHFTYRWLRNGKAIAKATAKTYVLKAADKGKRISVKVTGSKTGYRPLAATSPRTGKVK